MSGWFEYWREDFPGRREDPIALHSMNVERFFNLQDRDWSTRAVHSNICLAGRYYLQHKVDFDKSGSKGIFIDPSVCSSYSISIAMATICYFAACRTAHFGSVYYLDVDEVLRKRYIVDDVKLQHARLVFLEIPSHIDAAKYQQVIQLVRKATGCVFVYFSTTPSKQLKDRLFADIGGDQTFTTFDSKLSAQVRSRINEDAFILDRKTPFEIWGEG